ncbi:MAG: NosD domain-containing protein [Bacteroidota bacterium]|nr:NosD domain-containing protein [Bacteroidota bacterium]
MIRFFTVLFFFFLIPSLSFSQKIPKDSTAKKMSAIAFTVNAPGATSAFDDPDTDPDESMDGICADENGNCTITAAVGEATNIGVPVTITFSSSMTIGLKYGILFLSGSKILGEDHDVKIQFSTPELFEFEDNNEVKNITIENGGMTLHNNNTVTGCTFIGSPELTIVGSNNIIGGLNSVDRNVFRSGTMGIIIAMDETMSGGFNQILGNYIGVDATGAVANGNMIGIVVQGESGQGENIIDGNVISGSTTHGILISSSDKNIIRNNKIGTDATGFFALGNKNNGIHFYNSQQNLIEKNVIAGNGWSGISFNGSSETAGESSFNTVKFNFIGVNKDTLPIPNQKHGIEIIGKSNNNIIGSTLATDSDTNVIAHNTMYGIITIPDTLLGPDFPHNNIFRRNRMYGNSDPGILVNSKTQEDITRPVIDSIQLNLLQELIVHGSAKPKSIVDVYMASSSDPNKYGEGRDWLGKGITNDSGRFAVNIGSPQLNCDLITALQTDEQKNTSGNAKNVGIAPLITSLTQHCEPPLFGGIAYANNKYTIHINWKNLPKTGVVEFNLNGNVKPGIINGDIADVEYNMNQTVVGTNTLSWKLTTCENRFASGLNSYQFCGTPVPGWLDPVTAMCSSGHFKYTHEETFPDVPGIAAGLGIPPSMAFVGGLILSFADAPTFTTTLNIPGESTPIDANTSFKIGEYSTSLSISGTASTTFANCDNIDLTGTVTMTAGVSKDFTYGFNFGTIPSPPIPGIQQLVDVANAISHSLRVGATLSGEISGTATLAEGIEITGGSGGATLALSPFLDVATFHARGTGQVKFSFAVPSFSVTSVDASVTVTISESISGLSRSWSFPTGGGRVQGEEGQIGVENILRTTIPYKAFSGKSIGTDTTLEHAIAWNAKPAFAVGPNNTKAFAWVSYRISGANKVSDIAIKFFNGIEWSSVIAVTNDDNVDRNPAIVFDNSGNIVVSWERNTSAQAIPDSLQYSFAAMKNFNIMYSVRMSITGSQIGSGILGNADTYDASPKLAKGKDGNIMLAWQVGNGENLFGTDAAPMQLVVAHQWNGSQWSSFDTIPAAQSKMFQWDFAVHDGQNAILALGKDTQDDLSTGNDWEIFTIKKTNGAWSSIQQLTTNAIMEYGVNAAFTYDGIPIITWMRDTSILGSYGAVSASQEIWIPNAGMGFFNNSFAVGKDTMVLIWNEGTCAVISMSSVTQRKWSVPKFAHFTTDIQRSLTAQFATNGSLHIGYQQSPYNTLPNQFSDSGSLQLISIEKVSSPLGINAPKNQSPKNFALLDAYPNPFNASATIKFILPKQAYSVLTVTNILGREVARLVDGVTAEGEHTVVFNADRLASGVYFYTLRSGNIMQTKKIMLVK